MTVCMLGRRRIQFLTHAVVHLKKGVRMHRNLQAVYRDGRKFAARQHALFAQDAVARARVLVEIIGVFVAVQLFEHGVKRRQSLGAVAVRYHRNGAKITQLPHGQMAHVARAFRFVVAAQVVFVHKFAKSADQFAVALELNGALFYRHQSMTARSEKSRLRIVAAHGQTHLVAIKRLPRRGHGLARLYIHARRFAKGLAHRVLLKAQLRVIRHVLQTAPAATIVHGAKGRGAVGRNPQHLLQLCHRKRGFYQNDNGAHLFARQRVADKNGIAAEVRDPLALVTYPVYLDLQYVVLSDGCARLHIFLSLCFFHLYLRLFPVLPLLPLLLLLVCL